jgi:hypothetical protein
VDDVGIPDYVYLQYTGLSRIDLPLDVKVTVPDYEFQKKPTEGTGWQVVVAMAVGLVVKC